MHSEIDIRSLVGRPSAFVPVLLSVTALVVVVGHVSFFGAVRQADEGAAAHLWQLLLGVQVPIIAFFVIKWLPKVPRAALCVLALQLVALLSAVAPVFFLHL